MPEKSKKLPDFSRILLKWNRNENRRQMPWKGEKDPYRIWLSEIILQQTRVEQGLTYYKNFISTFPDITRLALAPEEKVFKLWEGLGYYSRCRNLIATAKFITEERKGVFPNSYDSILSLKGVGPYTAAAIASFAFNLPHAVVDGNVYRVLARIFGIFTPVDSTAGKKEFTALAESLLDPKQPGVYNQAIMDFGATICKPAPACDQCPFQHTCYAFNHKRITELPVKEKKLSIKKRWFYFFVINYKNQTVIRQRTAKDIWQQLYEFPLVETTGETKIHAVLAEAEGKGFLPKKAYRVNRVSDAFHQQLSHQHITGFFVEVNLDRKESNENGTWISRQRLEEYAFPRLINNYLEKDQLLQ